MVKISAGSSDLARVQTPGLAILLEAPPAEPPRAATADPAVQRVWPRRDCRRGRDETLPLLGTTANVERILLVGMGKVTDRLASLRRAAALAARRAVQMGFGRLAIFAGDLSVDDSEAIALGAIAGS